MKISIINGPNLNLLGKREPEIYGKTSFNTYFSVLEEKYKQHTISNFQSNNEGDLINELHRVGFDSDGIILNAAAYTHTSVALRDAISSIKSPVIEVHLSNTLARESFRHKSFIGGVCLGSIAGFGLYSYDLAIQYIINNN